VDWACIGCQRERNEVDGQRYVVEVMSNREDTELTYSLLARVNSVMFYLLWSCAPILVSIISFLAYVVQGNTLEIGQAFTVC
jgi:hypothetical protein